MTGDFIIVTTTADSEELAVKIAQSLVNKGIAACAQVEGPIRSVYRWKSAVHDEREWRCVAKTRAALYGAVEKTIREIHSYEVPEIIVTPVSGGSPDYLGWLEKETKGGNS